MKYPTGLWSSRLLCIVFKIRNSCGLAFLCDGASLTVPKNVGQNYEKKNFEMISPFACILLWPYERKYGYFVHIWDSEDSSHAALKLMCAGTMGVLYCSRNKALIYGTPTFSNGWEINYKEVLGILHMKLDVPPHPRPPIILGIGQKKWKKWFCIVTSVFEDEQNKGEAEGRNNTYFPFFRPTSCVLAAHSYALSYFCSRVNDVLLLSWIAFHRNNCTCFGGGESCGNTSAGLFLYFCTISMFSPHLHLLHSSRKWRQTIGQSGWDGFVSGFMLRKGENRNNLVAAIAISQMRAKRPVGKGWLGTSPARNMHHVS